MDPEVPPPLRSHFLFRGVQEVLEDLARQGPLSVPEPAAWNPRRKKKIQINSSINLDAAELKKC